MKKPPKQAQPPKTILDDRTAAVRERLMLAAAEAFAQNGYANVTVEDVSKHAGVSKRTFYEHFSSREDVLTGYVAYGAERIETLLDSVLQTQTDPILRVEAFVRSYCKALVGAPMVGYQVMAAGLEPRQVRMAALDRLVARLQKEFQSAYAAGQIKREPDEISVEIIFGGIDAWLLRCRAAGSQKEVYGHIDAVVDFVKHSFDC